MKFRAILNDKYDLEEIAQRKQSARPHHKTLIYFAVVWAVLNILAIIYITKSNYIYFWDDSTYWDIARKIASGAFSEGGFWHNVYNSVAEQDYNYIAGLPSALIVKIFGESRLAYVLGLVNLYLVTSFAMVYVLAKKVSKAPKIAAVISLMICPSMVFLTFNGFVDIGGLLGCLVCFNLYFVKDKDDDANLVTATVKYKDIAKDSDFAWQKRNNAYSSDGIPKVELEKDGYYMIKIVCTINNGSSRNLACLNFVPYKDSQIMYEEDAIDIDPPALYTIDPHTSDSVEAYIFVNKSLDTEQKIDEALKNETILFRAVLYTDDESPQVEGLNINIQGKYVEQ